MQEKSILDVASTPVLPSILTEKLPDSIVLLDSPSDASSPVPTLCDAASETTSHRDLNPSSSSTLNEEPEGACPDLTTFRLFMAHIGAALTLFLATTDATIVSTSLPTIASELQASESQYTWVGVSYMLTQTAFQPLYGRISDLVGRKNLLYVSMAIFAVGSLLCGASVNIAMLIASRALAGVGGGGIVSSVWVITSEIVEVRNRAKWSQCLSITWSCSAIAGPLLGGLFSGDSGSTSNVWSWRWGFYMNLPICLVAFLVLLISLRGVSLRATSDAPWNNLLKKFDFGGLFLFMSGTSCLVVGFSFATENGWTSPSTIALILLGLIVLVLGGVYETRTTRECLFPAATFHNLTVVIILVITFLHNFAFNAGTFYLALFFQAANGYTPLEAGIKLLPYSLGSSLASLPAAWFIGYWQKRSQDTSGQNRIISVGLLLSTLGFGLLILLNEDSVDYAQTLFPLIAGVGLGMLFHAPYQVFTKSLEPKELATGTSAFFLVRFTGATVGLAVAGAIFHARASSRFPSDLPASFSGSSIDFGQISAIEPLELKRVVLHVVSTSIQTIWTVCSPCLGVASIISLLLQTRPIENIPGEKATASQTSTSAETQA